MLELYPGNQPVVGRAAFDLTVSCPGYRHRSVDISDALPLVSPLDRTQRNALYSRPVTAAGEWAATGIVSYRLSSSYRLVINERIEGRLTGTDASGTLWAKAKLHSLRGRKPDIRCRQARLAWTAGSSPGRIFAGATAQSRPLVIELAEDGTSIQRARVSGWATCGAGRGTPTASAWHNLALDGNGAFAISSPYSYSYDGTRYRGRERIDGGITGLVLRGSFSDRWTQRDADAQALKCTTGSVRYRARTSQVGPTPQA